MIDPTNQIRRLVLGLDDDDGVNESIYHAIYELVLFQYGAKKARDFHDIVKVQDDRYFVHSKDMDSIKNLFGWPY